MIKKVWNRKLHYFGTGNFDIQAFPEVEVPIFCTSLGAPPWSKTTLPLLVSGTCMLPFTHGMSFFNE